MKPPISVIIPTKNSAGTLRRCIESIQHQSYSPIELIVIDNESSDATVSLAKQSGAIVYSFGNERSSQRNYGARISTGEYLLFVDSDMELSPYLIQECVTILEKTPSLQALTIPEHSFGTGFWSACKAFERSTYHGVPWMNSARLFRRSAYEAVGGFDHELIGGEDADIHNRILDRFGIHSIASSNERIYHNEGTLTLRYTFQKKYYYSKTIASYANKEHNKQNFSLQRNLIKRIALFLRHANYSNIHLVCGAICMKCVEFFAGSLGYIASFYTQKRSPEVQ